MTSLDTSFPKKIDLVPKKMVFGKGSRTLFFSTSFQSKVRLLSCSTLLFTKGDGLPFSGRTANRERWTTTPLNALFAKNESFSNNETLSGSPFSKNSFFETKDTFLGTAQAEKNVSSGNEIFFNTCFDKNHIKTVVAWFLEHYGEKNTVDLVETFKQLGFHQATLAGVSLGIDDLQIPPQKASLLSQASAKMVEMTQSFRAGNITSVEKSQRLIDTWNQTSEMLRQAAVQNFRSTNPVNPVYMMAFSGARGNISQVRQLVAMRGLMADPQGVILEFPIQSNFREGLTVTEYLISCFGARKGLVDTALRTATSGYLTRRLVDAVQHVVVHVTNCYTKKGILLKETNLEQRLVGRVLLKDLVFEEKRQNNSTVKIFVEKNTLISSRLAKKISKNYHQVFVRSPLTCQTENSVCQLCYGIDLAQGKLVSLGEAVGIIAAQSIGEPGTQLTMRTFHTGGVGVFSDQAMKILYAPFSGKIHFLGSLPGLFVRTPHGNIVYLLKHKTINKDQVLLRLTGFQESIKGARQSQSSVVIHKDKKSIYEIKHHEVPAGSLLWVKEGEVVQSGQILIQASRFQTGRQEMPESTHPVRAALAGEIFFESIKTRLIEKGKLLKHRHPKNQTTLFEKEKIIKEISPTIPFLRELGNFWVFSCFVQKQTEISRSFFRKGDLISMQTPIQQYNIQVVEKGQLKKVNSALVFAQSTVEVLFSKIYYSRKSYFGITPKKNIFAYTANSQTSYLTWYPFFKNFVVLPNGQSRCFEKNQSSLKIPYRKKKVLVQKTGYGFQLTLKNESFFCPDLKENSKNTGENFSKTYPSSLWCLHEVFKLNTINNFSRIQLLKAPLKNTSQKQDFIFLKGLSLPLKEVKQKKQVVSKNKVSAFPEKQVFRDQDVQRQNPLFCQKNGMQRESFLFTRANKHFSRQGIFHFKPNSALFWLKKTQFQSNFVTNFSNRITNTKTVKDDSRLYLGIQCIGRIRLILCTSDGKEIKNKAFYPPVFKKAKIKSQQKKELFNSALLEKDVKDEVAFIKKALNRVQHIQNGEIQARLIEKKQGWFYISQKPCSEFVKSQLLGIVLQPGKPIENLLFHNSYVSLNIVSRNDILLLNPKQRQYNPFSFSKKRSKLSWSRSQKMHFLGKPSERSKIGFSSKETSSPVSKQNKRNATSLFQKILKTTSFSEFEFWDQNLILAKKQFSEDVVTLLKIYSIFSPKFFSFNRLYHENFLFTKKQSIQPFVSSSLLKEKGGNGQNTKQSRSKNGEFRKVIFKFKRKRRVSHVMFIQKNYYQTMNDKKFFYQNWLEENIQPLNFSINSPLFTKQTKTHSDYLRTKKVEFQVSTASNSGWASLTSFLKVDIKVKSSKTVGKIEQFQQKRFLSNVDQFSLQNNMFCLQNFSSCTQKRSFLEKSFFLNGTINGTMPVFKIGLSVLFHRPIQLENVHSYHFFTFGDGWVLSDFLITQGFLVSQKLGEFRRIQSKKQTFEIGLLQTQDTATLVLPTHQFTTPAAQLTTAPFNGSKQKPNKASLKIENLVGMIPSPKIHCLERDEISVEEQNTKQTWFLSSQNIGTLLRYGEEIVDNFGTCVGGRIIKITPTKLILRKGLPLLASVRGLLHVIQGDLVQKNEILITLRSRRLQTEDIVQGIPKIEQLFEARETQSGEILQNNMHIILKKFFYRALQVKSVPEAVNVSVAYIQKFLVENILQAYSNQGVHIAEKHVEIVVRQMTTRVRIINGGGSGFLPGEIVQLRVLETLNSGLTLRGYRPATYEPIILGITKSVLQSESFLLAASFQQVSKVLVRSALAKKTDFLRGLHENLLVGQPIPAGTGIIDTLENSKKLSDVLE
jgi:hypothetical protein